MTVLMRQTFGVKAAPAILRVANSVNMTIATRTPCNPTPRRPLLLLPAAILSFPFGPLPARSMTMATTWGKEMTPTPTPTTLSIRHLRQSFQMMLAMSLGRGSLHHRGLTTQTRMYSRKAETEVAPHEENHLALQPLRGVTGGGTPPIASETTLRRRLPPPRAPLKTKPTC